MFELAIRRTNIFLPFQARCFPELILENENMHWLMLLHAYCFLPDTISALENQFPTYTLEESGPAAMRRKAKLRSFIICAECFVNEEIATALEGWCSCLNVD